ncbi:MAG TPA: protein kinase [Terracidiphilus sp.]|nr:protein kinase [Terracidiphilus sp.]
MTPELWARINPLFAAAVEKPRGERDAFVAEACGEDAELYQELAALIAAHEQQTVTAENTSEEIRRPPAKTGAAFSPGDLVIDRFRIVRMLGSGGMGEVYEAFDLEISQAIALKSIRSEIVRNSGALLRFKKEVQLARRLSGPNICRIHELFIAGSSTAPAGAFLTMELLDGITLSDRIRQSGAIPWREAQALASDMCAGLATIHDAGIIHRDFKSRNIMLVKRAGSTRAVVMDFGLAHEVRSSKSEAETALTLPGAILGTPEYMAPEQFEGRDVTPASDLFAFGVVLYEMLTGQRPFPSSNILSAAVLRGKRPEPVSTTQRKIPHRFDRVIGKCLEFDASRRYQSATELAQALRASPLAPRNLAFNRALTLRIAGVALLVLLGAGLAYYWQSRLYYRPNAEGEKSYQKGLAALREGSYLKATRWLGAAVNQDSKFVMAHARLAEAWSNLNFDSTAQTEMLIATKGENRVPPLDRMYLDAIRATLTRDFPGALGYYKKILDRLPDSEKAVGYVDLGLAFERAGDPTHALQSFKRASTLSSDNAASYMQAAILETHLNRIQDANHDFGQAQALYTADENPEGQAELDYQRGYLANNGEREVEATAFLNKALQEAKQLNDVQLEIRAEMQLVSVEYLSGKIGEAETEALAATKLAQENQLMSWAAEGLVRMANAEIGAGGSDHLQQADTYLQEALEYSQQDRVLALANFTLASLREQQHRSADVLQPARAAEAYYRANGYVADAGWALLLIGRAQAGLGQWRDALETANGLLALANQIKSNDLMVRSEELEGSVYIDMEDYPHSLEHYQNAFSMVQGGGVKPFEAVHCADVFWRMGEFEDAQRMLGLALPSSSGAGEIDVELLLAQLKYELAARTANRIIGKFPKMSFERKRNLQLDRAIAEAALGRTSEARRDLGSLLAQDGQPRDENGKPLAADDSAAFELAAARIYLATGDGKNALDQATKAEVYFESKHLMDSELRSSLTAAQAAKKLHDAASYKAFGEKSIDIQKELSHTWPFPEFNSYISRPDLKSQLKEIAH